MSRDEAHPLVPRLRFSEFQEDEEWAAKNLGSLCDLRAGKFVPAAEIFDQAEDGYFPCYGGNGLRGFTKSHTHFGSYPLIGRQGALCGNITFAAGRFYATEHAVVACPLEGVDVAWLFYQLDLLNLNRFATGQAQPGLSVEVLSQVTCASPRTAAEQRKIASCLWSLDEKIAGEASKLDALKVYKKGLMQELFPADSGSEPSLRFPEFRNMGGWVFSPMGRYIEEYREKSSVQDEYEVLTSARRGLVRQRDYFDNDRIAERDNAGFNIIPPNYLTYRSRSDDRRFYFNENNLGITGIISIYYPVFRIIGGINKFFIELLSHYIQLVGKHSVGTSQTVLSLNELRRVTLPVPVEREQQRIADSLSSIDDLIIAQAQKVELLKRHRRGLMQQLFPELEETPK